MKQMNAINPRQAAFLSAFNADTSSARNVVIAFEDVMSAYYDVDGDRFSPINIEFVLNVMASRPKLQKTAKKLISTLGEFSIKVDMDNTPADKSVFFYTVANTKVENRSKADRDAVRAEFLAKVNEFKAKELTSLIEWSKAQEPKREAPEFEVKKASDVVSKAISKQIQAAIESGADMAALEEAMIASIVNAFSAKSLNAIRDGIEDKERKAQQRQQEAELKAARLARDAEVE